MRYSRFSCKFVYSLLAFAAVWSGATLTAKADLVLLTMDQVNQLTIDQDVNVLALQATEGSTTESGGVGFINGSFQVFGDAQPSQSGTFTYADLNITNASQLGLVVIVSERRREKPRFVTATNIGASPNGLAGRITLDVYSPAGVLLQQHTLASDVDLIACKGHTGFVFALTATEAAQVNALGPNVVLTVGATFANAQGGPEVIQAVRLTP